MHAGQHAGGGDQAGQRRQHGGQRRADKRRRDGDCPPPKSMWRLGKLWPRVCLGNSGAKPSASYGARAVDAAAQRGAKQKHSRRDPASAPKQRLPGHGQPTKAGRCTAHTRPPPPLPPPRAAPLWRAGRASSQAKTASYCCFFIAVPFPVLPAFSRFHLSFSIASAARLVKRRGGTV